MTVQYGNRYSFNPTYDAEAFSEMNELHLLVLDGCHVSGDFSKWSRELKLLQWSSFPLSELPSELNLAKITVLDLSFSFSLRRLWKDETPVTEAPINLRRLILKNCWSLTTLPQDIGKRLSKLKVLDLEDCMELESLPDSIGEMKDLEQLILHDCEKLRGIPDTVGRLKKLKHLDLSYDCNLPVLGNALVKLGTLTALETLKLDWNEIITELPESFTGLISLVHLKMNHCRNLRTVKALPHSLRHLDLGRCSRLYQLPSLEGLTSLATLILENCRSLKEIEGLECLTTLEEVNLRNCTSKQPVTLQLQHKRAMHYCCLSRSNVAVKYDNDWSKSEPALQLITYHDGTFGFLDDGLVRRVSAVEDCDEVCMEATVEGENECVAVVICCVGYDENHSYGQGHFLDAVIVRKGQEVFRSRKLIEFKCFNIRDKVILCTLRRTHPLVRDLQHGDQIRVARAYPRWAMKVSGAICVVHGHGDDQVMSVNSRLLDVQQSRKKRAEFAQLILKDNSKPWNRLTESRMFREKPAKFARLM